MKLSPEELAKVRALGIYVTERCDGCPKVLNQSVRWTIRGRREVFCSEECRDREFESLLKRGVLGKDSEMPRYAHRKPVVQSGADLATKHRSGTPIEI